MLQQTQVDRVIPKYKEFLKVFPNVSRLASASLEEVLRLWQGLGYNRRAKFLHQAASVLVSEYNGRFPRDLSTLQSFPGVGAYTAGAVLAFAYNQPVVLIETNIRRVFIHHFFQKKNEVKDSDILLQIEKTLPSDNPREWYWALMDYGVFIKSNYGNTNVRSKHYTKQSAFAGSDREIRGAIIKLLCAEGEATVYQLEKQLQKERGRIEEMLFKLTNEGMVRKQGARYKLG